MNRVINLYEYPQYACDGSSFFTNALKKFIDDGKDVLYIDCVGGFKKHGISPDHPQLKVIDTVDLDVMTAIMDAYIRVLHGLNEDVVAEKTTSMVILIDHIEHGISSSAGDISRGLSMHRTKLFSALDRVGVTTYISSMKVARDMLNNAPYETMHSMRELALCNYHLIKKESIQAVSERIDLLELLQ